MPRTVDHDRRRRELTEALLRVAAREGITMVSVRTVAAEAGWSPGALRHYYPTKERMVDDALARLTERVAARMAPRISALDRAEDDAVLERGCELLEELLPLDPGRRDEMAVWLAVTAPNTELPVLRRWREVTYAGIRHQCRRVVARLLGEGSVLPAPSRDRSAQEVLDAVRDLEPLRGAAAERRVAALHAALDGLALHVHTMPGEIDRAQVRATLDQLLRDLSGRG